MYITITPEVVKRFEQENNTSLFSLLMYTNPNATKLLMLLTGCDRGSALEILEDWVKTKDLMEFLRFAEKTLEDMGYLSKKKELDKSKDDKTESSIDVETGEVKQWSRIWQDGMASAMRLGVRSDDYWKLEPRVTLDLLDQFMEDLEAEVKYKMDLSYNIGVHVLLGTHDPSNFPKEPPSEKLDSQKETSDEKFIRGMLISQGKFDHPLLTGDMSYDDWLDQQVE